MTFAPDAAGHLIHREQPVELRVLGPTVALLTADTDDPSAPGLLRGTVPPDHVIPLHAHGEPETLYVVAGTLQAAVIEGTRVRWIDVNAGNILHVPPRARHAFRNVGREPALALIITAQSMVRFFERVGTSLHGTDPGRPPPAEAVERFRAVTAERGDWNASADENAAIGIELGPP